MYEIPKVDSISEILIPDDLLKPTITISLKILFWVKVSDPNGKILAFIFLI